MTGGHATVLKHDQDSKYISYYLKTPAFFTEKKDMPQEQKLLMFQQKAWEK